MSPDARDRADEVYAELLTRQGEQWVQPRIDRTQRLLDLLDNPQKTYRVVHVTGTNGKTSTSRIIESILRAYGLRTGLFTSPHLERFTERVCLDGEPASDRAIVDAWDEIAPFVGLIDEQLATEGDAPLTFFELLTVLAFVVFADAPVDVAVVEVGMGGSWDSTNTADGDVAVFAPIGIDHADRLGDTVEAIAEIKAGIIKDGAFAVSARQDPSVHEVLRARARDRGAEIAFEGDQFTLEDDRLAVGGQMIDVQGLRGRYDEEYLPLYGAHQGRNAALAIAAVEGFFGADGHAIPADILAEGLGQVSSPGRLQLIGTTPTVVVDAAHNPHGAAVLADALSAVFDFDEWGIVLGVMGDKDAEGIIRALAPRATHIFATAPSGDRALDPDSLADQVEAAGVRTTVHHALEDALEEARAWAAETARRAVVVTGSVVLVGEALALQREIEADR